MSREMDIARASAGRDEYRSCVLLLYNAVMSIGATAVAGSKRQDARLFEITAIADAALTEMNRDHTSLVQDVLGIGQIKKKRSIR